MFRPVLDINNLKKQRKRKDSDSKLIRIDSEVKETVTVTCRENFNQYLLNTTLHGLRYVGDKSLSSWERYYFIIIIKNYSNNSN